MNESRYRLNGTIQSRGTVATFWQTSLVTARNITEASAGRAIQFPRSQAPRSQFPRSLGPAAMAGPWAAASVAAASARAVRTSFTQTPQQTANTTKPIDHPAACVLPPHSGSMHSG